MKKLSFLAIAICIIGMMTLPQAATAELTRLNTAELAGITGQAGFSFLGGFLGLEMEDGLVSYTDKDGVEGARNGGTISFRGTPLSDCTTIEADNISVSAGTSGLESLMRGSSVTLKNPTVTVNNFHSNVMLGPSPGIGSTLGVVGIGHMQVRTTGSVRVSAN